MPIHLTPEQINKAMIDLAGRSINSYLQIQTFLEEKEPSVMLVNSERFKTLFNKYYRIRQRPTKWYFQFYSVFDKAITSTLDFSQVLQMLQYETERYETSFCSKLVASINPDKPVIDSIVLRHLGLKLPPAYSKNRYAEICSIYEQINENYDEYLITDMGKYLVSIFRRNYPDCNISNVKMLDFVIWSSGR